MSLFVSIIPELLNVLLSSSFDIFRNILATSTILLHLSSDTLSARYYTLLRPWNILALITLYGFKTNEKI